MVQYSVAAEDALTGADANNPVHLERLKKDSIANSQACVVYQCIFMVGLGRCQS